MAKNDAHLEAEKLFPGDRAKQDAYLSALGSDSSPSTAKKRASTVRKKKSAPAPARRRRRA